MLTEAAGGATGAGVSHAGARAKAAAMVELTELRLRNLEPRAVDVLERLLTAESESVALGAANSLVDRSCGKAREPRRGGRIDHRDTTVSPGRSSNTFGTLL